MDTDHSWHINHPLVVLLMCLLRHRTASWAIVPRPPHLHPGSTRYVICEKQHYMEYMFLDGINGSESIWILRSTSIAVGWY